MIIIIIKKKIKNTIVDNIKIVRFKENENKNININIRKNQNFSPEIYNNLYLIIQKNGKN